MPHVAGAGAEGGTAAQTAARAPRPRRHGVRVYGCTGTSDTVF